ncbi:MAG: hypothetical protein HQK98_01710 [Nitrospirae bacterium]|nr:hypothetical protein [Nitrospirota bacterium]
MTKIREAIPNAFALILKGKGSGQTNIRRLTMEALIMGWKNRLTILTSDDVVEEGAEEAARIIVDIISDGLL